MATTTPDPLESCPTAKHCFRDAQAKPDMKIPEMAWGRWPRRIVAVSGFSETAMPLVWLGFSPTARQAAREGQLTPLRNPLDSISRTECPVERSPETASRVAAAPAFTLDTTFPTPMHCPAEAQATPLKVAIGAKSRVMALAGVTKRADPVARLTRVKASIKEPIRAARANGLIARG
jgi:hypothetical protein